MFYNDFKDIDDNSVDEIVGGGKGRVEIYEYSSPNWILKDTIVNPTDNKRFRYKLELNRCLKKNKYDYVLVLYLNYNKNLS